MRVMIKFALPVEASNTAIRTGKLQKVMQQIAEDLKPEAAYFFPTPTEGQRGGFVHRGDAGIVPDRRDGRTKPPTGSDFAPRSISGSPPLRKRSGRCLCLISRTQTLRASILIGS